MAAFAFLQSAVCRVESIIQRDDTYHIKVDITTTEGCCPICAVPSWSIHSYRQRYVKDMSIGARPVMLEIRTKRFRCRNPDRPKITFVEEVLGVLAKHARRTDRLIKALWLYREGRWWASRCPDDAAAPPAVSRATLLRLLRQHPMPQPLAPA